MNCPGCYFFSPAYIPKDGESILDAAKRAANIEDDDVAGHCHRYPPTVISEEPLMWCVPSVCLDDWCGEFVERK